MADIPTNKQTDTRKVTRGRLHEEGYMRKVTLPLVPALKRHEEPVGGPGSG